MVDLSKAAQAVRTHAAGIAAEVLFNFALPFLVYNRLNASMGDQRALLLSALPPVAWSIIEFIRKRRVDAVSILVVAGIVLSLLAFIGGGSARFLQIRENLVTGLIGLVFLGSAAIGKPLTAMLTQATMRRKSAAEARSFEELKDNRYFRRTMMLITLVWGFGLLAQTALACALVFAMSISTYLLVSPVVGYGTMGSLGLWTFWYGRRQKQRGIARRAAAEAASGTPNT